MSESVQSDKTAWKDLRERAGFTLAEMSDETGYSRSTINGLELNDEGSERLRARIRQVLGIPEPGAAAPPEAAGSQESPDALIWRKRALAAEAKLEKLQKFVAQMQTVIERPDLPSSGQGEKKI